MMQRKDERHGADKSNIRVFLYVAPVSRVFWVVGSIPPNDVGFEDFIFGFERGNRSCT